MQVRAELREVVQIPSLWFQSFQGVNCLWRISIIYTFQENYISRNICIHVIKLGSTVQSHAALNMDVEYTEPSSALTRISLTPPSPAGALAVSQELWLRGISSVPESAAQVGHTAMPNVWWVGQDSISPSSAGIKNFLAGAGLRSRIHAKTGPFQELRCIPVRGLCPHITEI